MLAGWVIGEVFDDLGMFSKDGDTLYIVTIDDFYDYLAVDISPCPVSMVPYSLAGNSYPFLVRRDGEGANWE